mmetsp:Transcript_27387/g.65829  ORF Transcript_27387/g.65829 Transcript_27387/m.65829 type:complete len:359 (+) Transcript_27387:776-1852(+)
MLSGETIIAIPRSMRPAARRVASIVALGPSSPRMCAVESYRRRLEALHGDGAGVHPPAIVALAATSVAPVPSYLVVEAHGSSSSTSAPTTVLSSFLLLPEIRGGACRPHRLEGILLSSSFSPIVFGLGIPIGHHLRPLVVVVVTTIIRPAVHEQERSSAPAIMARGTSRPRGYRPAVREQQHLRTVVVVVVGVKRLSLGQEEGTRGSRPAPVSSSRIVVVFRRRSSVSLHAARDVVPIVLRPCPPATAAVVIAVTTTTIALVRRRPSPPTVVVPPRRTVPIGGTGLTVVVRCANVIIIPCVVPTTVRPPPLGGSIPRRGGTTMSPLTIVATVVVLAPAVPGRIFLLLGTAPPRRGGAL